eukprot:gene33253-41033_t
MRIFPPGFQLSRAYFLAQYTPDGIPECLFSMPTLETLHLSENDGAGPQALHAVLSHLYSTYTYEYAWRVSAVSLSVVFINCVVMLTINGAYVYLELKVSADVVTVMEIVISVIKLSWNGYTL